MTGRLYHGETDKRMAEKKQRWKQRCFYYAENNFMFLWHNMAFFGMPEGIRYIDGQ